jgi:hypothetical protein
MRKCAECASTCTFHPGLRAAGRRSTGQGRGHARHQKPWRQHIAATAIQAQKIWSTMLSICDGQHGVWLPGAGQHPPWQGGRGRPDTNSRRERGRVRRAWGSHLPSFQLDVPSAWGHPASARHGRCVQPDSKRSTALSKCTEAAARLTAYRLRCAQSVQRGRSRTAQESRCGRSLGAHQAGWGVTPPTRPGCAPAAG